ncbi:unnamed protein product [Didymodactylos carnosus]|uniref:G-protein coupled receptors family 1 profile domain-containing protein n=1 Tax=Didymodactylos carnosus TaxID=1234261 RepID=A0A814CJY3_9BILA|nr:unnamed protein product [Didymodactylos carnosus]CAF1226496.1 unnamed protein product [Didymodactylos carnosus]CAF3717625.1 unnamed protein product [Didymodactylos carnosus]CAF4034541.1 unnamed protein product [Didymodactylos carnosus]
MNVSSNSSSITVITTTPSWIPTLLTNRLLSIYSLLLIIIGTPCNILCICIYFQKQNRSSSIKTIFGYLALLDCITLYTFNLNYVYREFYINQHQHDDEDGHTNGMMLIKKKNLEEYSLIICRLLSYTAFTTLQTSSWILAFGSVNRYLLIKQLGYFKFICKRSYTIIICLIITCTFLVSNIHILIMNGYSTSNRGNHTNTIVHCYKNIHYPNYMIYYQRFHLVIYSILPSVLLLIFNALLIRTIIQSKRRLIKHKKLSVALFYNNNGYLTISPQPTTATTARCSLRHKIAGIKNNKMLLNNPMRWLNRGHSRKLTLSLIFIAISFFILTFPSTLLFSHFRLKIHNLSYRRTITLFFTNLSTTTHVIRFFIYFFCSIDFRNDFFKLLICLCFKQHKKQTKLTIVMK